jgi:hypothetical protein
MRVMPTKLTPKIITAAILGFEEQKRHIDTQIHSTPMATLGVYVQELPESVRTAVEALDQKLCGLVEVKPQGGVQ